MTTFDAYRKIRIMTDQLRSVTIFVNSLHDELVSYRPILSRVDKSLPKSTPTRPCRLLRYSWLMVCMICFFVQTYHMTTMYMRFEVNADYVDYPRDVIEFPAINICVDKPFENECKETDCYPFLKTSRLLFDNVRSFEDISPGIAYQTIDGKRNFLFGEEFDDFYQRAMTKFRFNTYLCFQIDLTKYIGYNYSRMVAANMMAPIVFLIAISEPYSNWSTSHIPLFITEPGHYPTNSANVLTGHVPLLFKLFTYKRHALYLRPPPYATWCRDYVSEGLRSQTYCVQKCSLTLSLKNGTGVPMTFDTQKPMTIHGSTTERPRTPSLPRHYNSRVSTLADKSTVG